MPYIDDRCFETHLVSVSYFTSIVRSSTSTPNALHAGPARLSRAVRPSSVSDKEWSEYPGQVETLNELTGGSAPRATLPNVSHNTPATGKKNMVRVVLLKAERGLL
jgi:hypothetical protein